MRTPALHNIVIHSYIIIIKEIQSQLAIIYHAFIHALAYIAIAHAQYTYSQGITIIYMLAIAIAIYRNPNIAMHGCMHGGTTQASQAMA